MEVPPRFKVEEEKVCNLRKTFYALIVSPIAWFGRFTTVMKTMGGYYTDYLCR